MNLKNVIFFFLLFCCSNIFCQRTLSITKVFSLNIPKQNPIDSLKLDIFYSIDSSVFFSYKKRIFYKFTFSEALSDGDGYISYDPIQENILFIKDTILNAKNSIEIQKIFNFRGKLSYVIKDIGFIKGVVTVRRKVKKNGQTVFELFYGKIIDSHSIYISEIRFYKNKVIPHSLSVVVPFGNTENVKIVGQIFNGDVSDSP
jgi:hypothetical protein